MIEPMQLHDVTVNVTKKRIKNLHLKILSSDGSVHISAPMRMSVNSIRDFVLSKLDWIKKHQNRFQIREQILPCEYQEGENHYVWGNSYPLRIIEVEKSPKIEFDQQQIYLHIQPDTTKEKKQMIFELWYRMQLKQILPELIFKWEPIMSVNVKEFCIQKMKTRWGSCNYRTGKIRFNMELAKKSMECLEYVVVHEMVHLLEPSHNHRFKALMDQFMPEWRCYRTALKS